MTMKHRKPIAFKIAEDKTAPTKAKRKSARSTSAPEIELDEDTAQQALVPARDPLPRLASKWRLGAIIFATLGGLVSLWAGLTVTQLLEDLFARNPILGWAGTLLLGCLVMVLIIIIVSEIAALLRLRRIGRIQGDAALAVSQNDNKAANRALLAIQRLYANRADARWGLQLLSDHQHDIIDAPDRMRLIERDLLAPFDAEAGRIIARTARRIAVITAILPAPALDILVVGAQNLTMLRQLAVLYGGKPGRAGLWRLARMVLSHLAVTGGLALSDGLMQQLLGKGLAGRISTRFGEGTVNGIFSVRIGLAAMDILRPVAFKHGQKPGLNEFIKEIVSTTTPQDKA